MAAILFCYATHCLVFCILHRYDLVDLSRQSLQLISTMIYHNIVTSAKAKQMDQFQSVHTFPPSNLNDLLMLHLGFMMELHCSRSAHSATINQQMSW